MKKQKINSRQKGARGERELAGKLIEMFQLNSETTYLGCQHAGGPDSPYIKSAEMYSIWHIECKRVNRLNLWKAVEQAVRDASETQVPVVIHRADRQEWLLTVRLDDVAELAKRISSFIEGERKDVSE